MTVGPEASWWVYVLRCADGTFYAGVARQLHARLREHNGEARGGARYTRGRRPVALYAARPCRDRVEATRLEWRVKRLRRAQKLALIGEPGWLDGTSPELSAMMHAAPPKLDSET